MNKKVSVSVMITTVLIAMTVTFSITMVMAMRMFDSTVASVKEKESMYNKIAELDKYVRANDYYPIDETILYDTMTAGYLLGTADRYARYYPAAAYAELLDIQNGKKIGIGVEIIKDAVTGYAQVVKVYPGSPAADLGMTVGCYITTIDEAEVKGIATADGIVNTGHKGGVLQIVSHGIGKMHPLCLRPMGFGVGQKPLFPAEKIFPGLDGFPGVGIYHAEIGKEFLIGIPFFCFGIFLFAKDFIIL